jgi:hypothetical protein
MFCLPVRGINKMNNFEKVKTKDEKEKYRSASWYYFNYYSDISAGIYYQRCLETEGRDVRSQI